MAGYSGPEIANSGLVLHLDAANYKNFSLTSVEVLVVAGGGGGGVCWAGGGGGGGLIYNSSYAVIPGTVYTVTVGAGGTNQVNVIGNGGNGGNSVFGNLTAVGGGGGGGACGSAGLNGGSGGGGSSNGSSNTVGGSGTVGQGYAGNSSPASMGGGGGGAGGGGLTATQKGNNGLPFGISGTVTYYSGGGSGGGPLLTGGLGGGGSGGTALAAGVADATPNTGGGGGGSIISGTGVSGVGGSGIVIVRYQGPQRAIGGTVTTSGKYTIHTFTSVGSTTFTPMTSSTLTGLADLSGNNNFGTPVNGPTYNSANGGSIVFDGVNDYIDLNSNNIISGTNPFTFDCWFSVNQLYNSVLLTNYTSAGTGSIWLSGRYGIWFGTGASVYFSTILGVGLHNVTYTRDSSGNVNLYYKGSLANTGTNSMSVTTANNFRIGSDTPTYGEQLSGNIYSMKVYNRVLSATEILQSFEATRSRFGI